MSLEGPNDSGARHIELVPAHQIRSERIRWAWEERFPLRSLSVVAGEKGLGKSLLTNARLPAAASRGELPGELKDQPIDVIIATAEDDWRTVVKPRLAGHGADLKRIHEVVVKDKDGKSLLTLPDDVPLLAAKIRELRDGGRVVGMMVIDPISAFLSPGTDTHRDASVRRALAPLAALANDLDIVIVVVAHLTKDEAARLINRVSGSGAFVNASRSVLTLARNPDDPEGERGRERVLVHVASNWGRFAPTLAAHVEERDVDLDDGNRTSIGYLQITGESDIGLEDLQGAAEHSTTDAEEAIAQALKDGPRPSREVKAQVAAELKCTRKTVERHAMKMKDRGELGLETSGFPKTTTWWLRNGDSVPPPVGTADSCSVGTSTNFHPVPTAERPVLTQDSASSGDSSRRVPTGGETALADLTDDEILCVFRGAQLTHHAYHNTKGGAQR